MQWVGVYRGTNAPPNIERTVHKIRIREYWVHLLRMLQHFGVLIVDIVNNLVNTYSIGCPHIGSYQKIGLSSNSFCGNNQL